MLANLRLEDGVVVKQFERSFATPTVPARAALGQDLGWDEGHVCIPWPVQAAPGRAITLYSTIQLQKYYCLQLFFQIVVSLLTLNEELASEVVAFSP
jgi:hypothetical protein